MTLIRQRLPRDPEKFPTVQLALLAIVRLAEPIALTSIFPYAWPLVKKFHVGNENDASFYAGLLISAFALAEALTGMYWGALSDRIGRKPVLLVGCFGTMISMIMVGFASNFWFALLGRVMGGFLNGNIAVIQTMVGELVTKPEHEPKAYAVMPFVWSIGTIIGPAMGGTLADPSSTLPQYFSSDGIFGKFPYLLPNLICAGALMVSILLGYFFLEESHPDMQPRVLLPDDTFVSAETPLVQTIDAIKAPAVDLRAQTYGTFQNRNENDRRSLASKTPPTKVFNKSVIMLIAALGLFTYHSMTYDHLLPIYFQDARGSRIISSRPATAFTPGTETATKMLGFNPLHSPGGLGLSTQAVGGIMSIDGIIALFIQAVIFPPLAASLGIHKLFILVSLHHPITFLMMPWLVYLPSSLLHIGIYSCLIVRNILSITAYPVLLILIKEATPDKGVLGQVNGLAASAGAACRTVAPPIAGYLYAAGSKMEFTALAWYGSAFVALIGALQCFSVKRRREGEDEEDGKEDIHQPISPASRSVVSLHQVD